MTKPKKEYAPKPIKLCDCGRPVAKESVFCLSCLKKVVENNKKHCPPLVRGLGQDKFIRLNLP